MINTYQGSKIVINGKPISVLKACYTNGEEDFCGHVRIHMPHRHRDGHLVEQVTSYKDIRYIVVVFSGHGGEGTLLGYDSKTIYVEDIVDHLKPVNMPNASEEIVKLFFDVC